MKYIAALIISLFALSLNAQKVGVVLSGGGAKGLYHIGIIKALEENGIPIDYVAGTSIGSIVAGLYAIGFSPEEMEALALSDEIKSWVNGRIDPHYYYYFKRMNPNQAMITLNLDLKSPKNIAVIPTSLISSNQLDISFSNLFSPSTALAGGDFDKMFVPFRCVASDVYNKKEVVFRKGNMGEAIRASMAIPLVYKAVRYDSLLLYDGGIFNNFPWEVVEEDFCPDIIIGGKCVAGLKNPDENSLMDQIETITMMHTDFTLPEGKGIMIERIFDNVGMLDFGRAQYIMEKGYEDAMALMDSIKGRIPRRVDSEEVDRRRLAYKSELPELVFDELNITGLNSRQTKYVRNTFGFNEEGDVFNYEEFKTEYFKILSEGDIIGGFPVAVYNDTTGYFGMNIELKTKPSFKVMLGGNISSTSLNQAYVGLEYKIMGLNAHSARADGNFSALHTSLSLGWRSDFHLRKQFFYDVKMNYNHYNYLKSSYRSLFSIYGFNESEDTYLSVSAGLPLGRSSVFQVKSHLGVNSYYYFETPGFDPFGSSDKTRFGYYAVQAEASKQTTNYPLYPTRGIYQSLSAIYVDGKEKFRAGSTYPDTELRMEADREWFGARFMREEYFHTGRWFSFGYLVDVVATDHPEFSTDHATNFTSPAFTPTVYSKSIYIENFRNKSYAGLGLMPTFEFSPNLYLKNSAFAYVPGEYFEPESNISAKIRYILSSSLVFQTPIGPASLTVTNMDAGRKNWFVSFNFGYTIFGKKGLFY